MKTAFEKYFLGEMSEEERKRFEEELEKDPNLKARFEEDREFLEQLRTQMLREKVNAALSAPQDPENVQPGSKRRKSWWWLSLFVLAILGVLAVWNWPDSLPTAPSIPAPGAEPPQLHQEAPPAPDVPVAGQTPPKKNQPIAEAGKEALEAHPLQGLRGEEHKNSPWKSFVEQTWDAPLPGKGGYFPPPYESILEALSHKNFMEAYTALEEMETGKAASDTLVFLKGYCLMELWEGQEALYYYNSLKGKQHPWQAETEWYRGLSFLLLGQKKEALTVFREIEAKPGHRFQKSAKVAAAGLSGKE